MPPTTEPAPYTADEEAVLRRDMNLDSPWARPVPGGWPEVVARLLVTLDADRAAVQATPEPLRQRAAFLADRAARAVTEPRRFHESADEQHDLSVAIADVRAALRGSQP